MNPRAGALTALVALCVVPAVYAAQRLYDVAVNVQLDPAVAPPSPHIALFWRVGVAAVLAAGVAGPAYRLAVRAPTGALRLGEVALVASAALLALQAAVAP